MRSGGADYSGMATPTLHRVHRRLFAVIAAIAVSVLLLPAGPLAAQDDDAAPGLAPAIGPWAGAPRGQITSIRPGDDSIIIDGVARDPNSATAVSYEVLVDGLVMASGATPRPDGFGRTASFSESIRVTPGLHQVCLRLSDVQLGKRTVSCRTAVTAPPDRVDPTVAAAATGVVVSPTGVVMPVQSGEPGNWTVTTPCGATATVTNGEFIERARVVIDPGHGGSESGSANGSLLEKHVNLDVSNRVIAKLNSLGITAELTRTADYRVPIKTRADIASALAPDVFLSLHHNGGALRPSSRPGTEVFYAEGRPESRRLAAIMYEELVDAASQFDAQWVSTVSEGASLRLREDGADLYGIHRFSPGIESIITEFLYLSNSSEAALLRRPEVLDAQAQAIVDGILRWWFTTDDGTTLGREFTDSSSSGTGGFENCADPALTARDIGFSVSRAEILTVAAGDIPGPTPARSLLPALFLANDPAIG